MSASSFQNKKALRFTIVLGTGTFTGSLAAFLNNTIILQGFRASVDINKAGGNQMGTLQARIYGVAESDMNSITTLMWKPDGYIPNTVTVTAIDGNQETQIFAGNIVQAWGNFQSQPDVYLEIQAQTAYVAQLRPVSPVSFQGSVDVATIAQQITNTMSTATNPLSFENNGVTTQLFNTYLAGTGLDQLKSLVKAANCDLYLDDNIVAICPRGVPRGGLIPLISPQSGLVSYPAFDNTGVNFRCLFNPALRFGGSVSLQCPIPKANGQYTVLCVGHQLESEKPGGAWHSIVKGVNGAVTGAS